MALGLGRFKSQSNSNQNVGVTLVSLLDNPTGFPLNYLPKVRDVEGRKYIQTSARGKDINNKTVFYKWIFINPSDLSATADSDTEYALVPEHGFIMRIMQRSLLPYHENFIIDYYEDIENMSVISMPAELKNEYVNRSNNAYRYFKIGSSSIPDELNREIYNYPEAFFKAYIESAIPVDLLYTGKKSQSNHMSAYGDVGSGINIDMGIMSHGLNNGTQVSVPKPRVNMGYNPVRDGSNIPNRAPMQVNMNSAQDRINASIAERSNEMSVQRAKSGINQPGIHVRQW